MYRIHFLWRTEWTLDAVKGDRWQGTNNHSKPTHSRSASLSLTVSLSQATYRVHVTWSYEKTKAAAPRVMAPQLVWKRVCVQLYSWSSICMDKNRSAHCLAMLCLSRVRKVGNRPPSEEAPLFRNRISNASKRAGNVLTTLLLFALRLQSCRRCKSYIR